jgi:glutathione S-transferase
MADLFEARASDSLMQEPPSMAHLILAVSVDIARKRGLGDLTDGRPQLAAWMRHISGLPGMRATALP